MLVWKKQRVERYVHDYKNLESLPSFPAVISNFCYYYHHPLASQNDKILVTNFKMLSLRSKNITRLPKPPVSRRTLSVLSKDSQAGSTMEHQPSIESTVTRQREGSGSSQDDARIEPGDKKAPAVLGQDGSTVMHSEPSGPTGPTLSSTPLVDTEAPNGSQYAELVPDRAAKHPEAPNHSPTASEPRGDALSATEGIIHISLDTQAAEGFGRGDDVADGSASSETTQVQSDDDLGVLAGDSRAGSVDTRASNYSNQAFLPLEPGRQLLFIL
jgi:hypothetical protein